MLTKLVELVYLGVVYHFLVWINKMNWYSTSICTIFLVIVVYCQLSNFSAIS